MDTMTQTEKHKPPRMSWKNESYVRTFLEACINEVATQGREGASLKAISWQKVAQIMKDTHNVELHRKQMKNHFDYLRGKYGAWCKLKNKTGNVYDPSTNMFNLTDEEWKQEIQANKHVEALRSSPLMFPDLCTQLFDGTTATGVDSWGPSSRVPRTLPNNEEVFCIEDMTFDAENQGNTSPTPTPVPPPTSFQSNSSTTHNQGERAKKRPRQATFQPINPILEEKIANALDFIVGSNRGPSMKECKEKLDSLGWGADNELHKCALGIFSESASYREAWMCLEINEIEAWIRMIGRKNGFL